MIADMVLMTFSACSLFFFHLRLIAQVWNARSELDPLPLISKKYTLYTTGLLTDQSDNLIVAFLIESPTFQRPLACVSLA